MALIDKETIRAEIERLIEMNKTKRGFPAGSYCAIRIEAYEHLLSFLDTLEQSVDEPEEEFSRFIKKEKEEEPDGSLPSYGDYGIYRIARHFYELGLNSKK